MISLNRLYILFGLLGLICFPATAQSSANERDTLSSENDREYRGKTFKVVCWGEWTKEDLYIGRPRKSREGRMTKVSILNMRQSKAYPYKSGEPVVFYKQTDDEKKPYEKVISVTIPQTCSEPLIMLVLKKKKVEHMVYDLDAKQFPYGSFRVVNFSPLELRTIVGKDKFILKPKSDRTVIPNSSGKPKAVPCRVAVKSKNKTKVVYSSMLMNRPYKRHMLFFYPTKDEVGRTVFRSRSLVDFKPKGKRSRRSRITP